MIVFDFSQSVKLPSSSKDMQQAGLSLATYNQDLSSIQENSDGLFGALCFHRYMFLGVANSQINAVDGMLQQEGYAESDRQYLVTILEKMFAQHFIHFDEKYLRLVAIPDSEVINADTNKIERKSQIIGIGAYASGSLFVDLLLGLRRYHFDTFGTIDNRFEREVISKGSSTKSVFVENLEAVILNSIFSIKDYALHAEVESKLVDSLKAIFLQRFDEANLYYAKETQWLGVLSELKDEIAPVTEMTGEEM